MQVEITFVHGKSIEEASKKSKKPVCSGFVRPQEVFKDKAQVKLKVEKPSHKVERSETAGERSKPELELRARKALQF